MILQLDKVLNQARKLSWANYGKKLDIFLPGGFNIYGRQGRYPVISITGEVCELSCKHCSGRLLKNMISIVASDELLFLAYNLYQKGERGVLLSGGSDIFGRLPWRRVLSAIARIKIETDLIVTAHVGYITYSIARALKSVGVAQALVNIVEDEITAREILRLRNGLISQMETIIACQEVGLEIIPHVILGLYRGYIYKQDKILELLTKINPNIVVYVVFMPIKNTPLFTSVPPLPIDIANFLVKARLHLPNIRHHLGCARPRGPYRVDVENYAITAGINGLALASDAALDKARQLGLKLVSRDTCCSLIFNVTK